MATNAINIHEDLSKGSAKKKELLLLEQNRLLSFLKESALKLLFSIVVITLDFLQN